MKKSKIYIEIAFTLEKQLKDQVNIKPKEGGKHLD